LEVGRRGPAAGRHHRHAQDRAEAADDPGAEDRGGALRQRPAVEDLPAAAGRAHLQPGAGTDQGPEGRGLHHARPGWLKTALVTGAARGIGRAAADALQKAGLKVLRLDLQGELAYDLTDLAGIPQLID